MQSTKKLIHVAVGVIQRDEQIFISKRPDQLHQGGRWEFPGGKVEQGETVVAALTRELMEEVGLQVLDATPLMQLEYAYPEKTVLLDVWLVSQTEGLGEGLEGQQVAWVHFSELSNYQFPDANQPILDKVLALYQAQ
ncbi:8-oxo-dGTP diphosphatase MutT [Rheinheimera riviphila]|uniref:8-oxo-dGTP diphosphatase n=2 Tax=Rheinheimera riviphila TaxID=1834037 RepID=A0A437QF17_9GAMM|nr:8-oxo-dGTP diphosphatase MutT [Rheinheimera riviphila]